MSLSSDRFAAAERWLLAHHGRRLEPGHIVITGSLVQGPLVQPGQHVRARFTHLGEVEVSFVE